MSGQGTTQADFNIGDTGVLIQLTPNIAIPAGVTTVTIVFLARSGEARLVLTGTVAIVNTVQVVNHTVSSGDGWSVPDTYYIQVVYTDLSGNSRSTLAPYPTIVIGQRE